MWEIALDNLRHRTFRLVSTGLAVILGVAFLSGSGILTDTIGRSFNTLIEEISTGIDVSVRSSDVVEADFIEVRARIPAETLETVAAVDGVADTAAYVEGFAQLVDPSGEPIGDPRNGAPTIGFSWVEVEQLSQFTLVEGRAPTGPGEIVLDRTTAEDNGFGLGDPVTALLQVPAEEFEVVGIASFGEDNALLGATLSAFHLDTAQRILGEPGMINSVLVMAESGVDSENLSLDLDAALPDGLETLTYQESVAEGQADFADVFSFFETFMTAFALIALFVAGFIIYNTFSILVAQRKRETALLRALGAGGRQVIGSLLVEAVVVGVIASALGVLGGIGVAAVLKAGLAALGFEPPSAGLLLEPPTLIEAFVAGLVITVISAVIPAVRASRIAPMVALRRAAVDSSTISAARNIFGGVMTIAGIVGLLLGLFGDVGNELVLVGAGAAALFIGVAGLGPLVAGPFSSLIGSPIAVTRGLPGELARENSMRNPKRTATSAAALTVGVGLVCAISVFASSVTSSVEQVIDDTVVGDLVMDGQSQGFGGLSTDLVDRLNEAPEVEAASGVRTTVFRVEDDDSVVNAFDTAIMDRLFDVEVIDGDLAGMGLDGLAVLDTEAEDKGWSVGTVVVAHFVDSGDQTFTVEVIYGEGTLAGPMFISNEAFEANVDEVFDAGLYILRNPDVDPVTFRSAVEQIAESQPNAVIHDQEELKDFVGSEVDQILGLIYGLLALAVIIALIGIANTLSLSISERTNEIGLLRALGTTRSQLRSAIRWESLLIALLGTTLGLAVGLFLGWAMVTALADEGIEVFAVDPTTIIAVVIMATIAGVLASLRPSSKAARLPVLDAIAGD